MVGGEWAQRDDSAGWRIGILRDSGRPPVGAGVLVDGRSVLTCAHVVAKAVGADAAGPPPTGSVWVVFAGVRRAEPLVATVVPDGWFSARDDGGDAAVLRLEGTPPPEAEPARVRACGAADGRAVSAYGYPGPAAGGMWAEAKVLGRGGADPQWVQLDGIAPTGVRVERGFSGAGVWDQAARAVIGMVVAEYVSAGAKVSWMLPMETLAGYGPALAELLSGASAFGPPANVRLTTGALTELADALLAVPFMLDAGERQAMVARLRPAIAAAVPHSPRARLDVLQLIRTCEDYDGGLAELVEAVLVADPESAPSRRLKAVAGRLPGGGGRREETADGG